MSARYKFSRMELAGSLGDLGTLLPIAIVIGLVGGIVTFLLLDNITFPAGLMVVAGGLMAGLILGARIDLGRGNLGLNLPQFLPFAFPAKAELRFALFVLVLPQLPMTLGNAVLAYTDLSQEYFKDKSSQVTNRNVCISMALANFSSFCFGGMPLCHGAGIESNNAPEMICHENGCDIYRNMQF